MDKNIGYCHCCRSNVEFYKEGLWLRDEYRCSNCRSIPRQRHVQYVLDNFYHDWETKKIHESSPSNSYISNFSKNYDFSFFYDNTPPPHKFKNINLEQINFEDNTFDIFITQDVLEHIFNPKQALREILRVLKPNGIHIFTTPKHKDRLTTKRSEIINGDVKFLLDPVYHGNPIGDHKSLVTFDFGTDFEDLCSHWTQTTIITYSTKNNFFGLDGEYLEVFVQKKIL